MTAARLKYYFAKVRMWMSDKFAQALGVPTIYRLALSQAAEQLSDLQSQVRWLKADNARLESTVARLDRGHSLDVRSNLQAIDFDNLGDIVWIKVSDPRMLRAAVFSQIHDYMRSHGKGNSILVVTDDKTELTGLSDSDLQRVGLRRLMSNEQ